MTPNQAAAHLRARLSGDEAGALDVLLERITYLLRRQTLGGEPPPFNADQWVNRKLPDGPDPEFRGL